MKIISVWRAEIVAFEASAALTEDDLQPSKQPRWDSNLDHLNAELLTDQNAAD